jgi:hypothetical protein
MHQVDVSLLGRRAHALGDLPSLATLRPDFWQTGDGTVSRLADAAQRAQKIAGCRLPPCARQIVRKIDMNNMQWMKQRQCQLDRHPYVLERHPASKEGAGCSFVRPEALRRYRIFP